MIDPSYDNVLCRYENIVWDPLMENIHNFLNAYIFNFLPDEVFLDFRQRDAELDAAHHEFVLQRTAWEVGKLSEEERLERKESWAYSMARLHMGKGNGKESLANRLQRSLEL